MFLLKTPKTKVISRPNDKIFCFPIFQNDYTVKFCSRFATITLFARFDLKICKWLNSQMHLPTNASPIYVKNFIFSGVCRNLTFFGVKKCTLTQYNSGRCLTLANLNTEYDLFREVVDM